MSEVFVAAAAHQLVEPGQSRADAAGAVLQSMLHSAGLLARRIPEIHWQATTIDQTSPPAVRAFDSDPEGPWLVQLAQRHGFPPDAAAFAWPAAPLLDHFVLQSAARGMQGGQRELVVVGQFSSPPGLPGGAEQAAALLLAAPAAVGRYNLAPRARIAAMLPVNGAQGGLLRAARAGLLRLAERERAERQPLPSTTGSQHILPLPEELGGQAGRNELQDALEAERFELPMPEDITWLAGSAQPAGLAESFPNARWTADGPSAPGALLLLSGLLSALETRPDDWGLLLSSGPHDTGLITLIERT